MSATQWRPKFYKKYIFELNNNLMKEPTLKSEFVFN